MAKKLLTTPKGVAIYPHLTPGRPDTKFDKDGVYTVKLKPSDNAEALKFAKEISAAAKAKVEETRTEKEKEKKGLGKKVKAAALPVSKETDDEGNETGALVFSFKMKAKGKKKDGTEYTREPVIFDAAGKPVKGLRIGGGSIIRVSYELNTYDRPSTEDKGTFLAGASLRLHAVQVIELVEFGGNAQYFGFENEAGDAPVAQADGDPGEPVAAATTTEEDDPDSADAF